MDDLWEQLRGAAGAWGIALSDAQLDALRRYYELLIDWNARVNLTRIIAPDQVIDKHFLDSLACLRTGALPAGRELALVDVATGAGLPGIPLRIARPDLRVVLLEATGKKVDFLRRAVAELDLTGVAVVQGRAEDLGHEGALREQFDVATARALGHLATVAELGMPLLRTGGRLIAMKGPQGAAEGEAAAGLIAKLGGELEDTLSLSLPLSGDPRLLMVFRKRHPTPRRFPRPWQEIRREAPPGPAPA